MQELCQHIIKAFYFLRGTKNDSKLAARFKAKENEAQSKLFWLSIRNNLSSFRGWYTITLSTVRLLSLINAGAENGDRISAAGCVWVYLSHCVGVFDFLFFSCCVKKKER